MVKNGTKVKKVKDPNAPKRPVNAYMRYAATRRTDIQKESPELIQKEILSKIGEEWRALSEEEKEPFRKEAQIAKAAYEKLKAQS